MNSIKNTARLAGTLYLILAALSAFGLVYVPSVLIASGDGATTVSNILANEQLFRLGIVSNLLAFTVNIFVVVFLYRLLKPVHRGMASLMVILKYQGSVVFGFGIGGAVGRVASQMRRQLILRVSRLLESFLITSYRSLTRWARSSTPSSRSFRASRSTSNKRAAAANDTAITRTLSFGSSARSNPRGSSGGVL